MTDPRTALPTGMPDDAPTTSVAVRTTASPTQLWPLLTDPATPAPFSAELEGAHWVATPGVDPPGLGARFVGRNRWRDREWSTLSTVTLCDEPHRFGWTVEDLGDPVSDWTYEVVPVGDAWTLRFTARMGPSPHSGLNRAIAASPDDAATITERRLGSLAASMQRTLEGIAAIAEGRTPAAGE